MSIVVDRAPSIYAEPFVGINGDTVPILAGMPVAQPTTQLKRAGAASGFALAQVVGIAVGGAGLTMPLRVLSYNGVVTLPTATWDLVTGGSGGLVPGAKYFLGVALGTMSTAAPTAPGQYLKLVGSAVTSTVFLVHLEPAILL